LQHIAVVFGWRLGCSCRDRIFDLERNRLELGRLIFGELPGSVNRKFGVSQKLGFVLMWFFRLTGCGWLVARRHARAIIMKPRP
jgi:hypothetical protein